VNAADARAVQRAEVEKVIPYEGQLLLTSHFFFNDYDETPVAITTAPGRFRFFTTDAGRQAATKRDARLERLHADQN
jgi:hypothetical protein